MISNLMLFRLKQTRFWVETQKSHLDDHLLIKNTDYKSINIHYCQIFIYNKCQIKYEHSAYLCKYFL